MRVCVIGCVMTTPAKKRALRASGILNPHPKDVRSELFTMDFFDAFDRAQVKYEMLRAHSVDGDSVAEACRQFGFSRESFYQIQQGAIKCASHFIGRERRVLGNSGVGTRRCCWTNG